MAFINQAVISTIGDFTKASPLDYQAMPAGAATIFGPRGAKGDYIETIVVVVSTAATAQVQITDGSDSAITIFPNSPGSGVGTYTIYLAIASKTGAWTITTGAGSTALVTGRAT